ncbi:jg12920 [Pararge aegeria aegeria]|uniref:Jg12920 protein n=1 Tax=Pararge aegeria aegeria TaxID=348720 RepID=A0A8S4SM87_9NEOP|nr:jg12920 [Pararge aegeria aegeria]
MHSRRVKFWFWGFGKVGTRRGRARRGERVARRARQSGGHWRGGRERGAAGRGASPGSRPINAVSSPRAPLHSRS